MTRWSIITMLIFAATLEAGGDALIRAALHTTTASHKGLLFAVAALVLFAYGIAVNASPWEFGKLLGLYVVFFFVIAQLISWLIFKETPSPSVIVGGAFIVAGGIIIAASNLQNHRLIGASIGHSSSSANH